MIDGGHLRSYLKKARKPLTADYIELVGLRCGIQSSEEIIRILYYGCAPFAGTTTAGFTTGRCSQYHCAVASRSRAQRPLRSSPGRFEISRLRGQKNHQPSNPPVDSDFIPKFQQKGVDMRIGLDMATISANRSVELIALMTNDTDCIPAMKLARRAGIQVALICIPGCRPAPELLAHSDFKRAITWP